MYSSYNHENTISCGFENFSPRQPQNEHFTNTFTSEQTQNSNSKQNPMKNVMNKNIVNANNITNENVVNENVKSKIFHTLFEKKNILQNFQRLVTLLRQRGMTESISEDRKKKLIKLLISNMKLQYRELQLYKLSNEKFAERQNAVLSLFNKNSVLQTINNITQTQQNTQNTQNNEYMNTYSNSRSHNRTFNPQNQVQNPMQKQLQHNPMQNQLQHNPMQKQLQHNPMQNQLQHNPMQKQLQHNPMQNQLQHNPMQNQLQHNPMQNQLQHNSLQQIPMQQNQPMQIQDLSSIENNIAGMMTRNTAISKENYDTYVRERDNELNLNQRPKTPEFVRQASDRTPPKKDIDLENISTSTPSQNYNDDKSTYASLNDIDVPLSTDVQVKDEHLSFEQRLQKVQMERENNHIPQQFENDVLTDASGEIPVIVQTTAGDSQRIQDSQKVHDSQRIQDSQVVIHDLMDENKGLKSIIEQKNTEIETLIQNFEKIKKQMEESEVEKKQLQHLIGEKKDYENIDFLKRNLMNLEIKIRELIDQNVTYVNNCITDLIIDTRETKTNIKEEVLHFEFENSSQVNMIELIDYSLPFCNFNITEKNNLFSLLISKKSIIVTVEPDHYTIEALIRNLNSKLARNKIKLSLLPDNKLTIESPKKIELVFEENTIWKTLGFSRNCPCIDKQEDSTKGKKSFEINSCDKYDLSSFDYLGFEVSFESNRDTFQKTFIKMGKISSAEKTKLRHVFTQPIDVSQMYITFKNFEEKQYLFNGEYLILHFKIHSCNREEII